MEIKQVDCDISVSPQITAADLPEIVKSGFKSIVCNRPDGEGNDQPLFHEIEEAAKQAGLSCHYLPVVSGKVTDEDAESFGKLFAGLPKPALAYCRTGTRSVTLWSLSRAGMMGLTDILEKAQNAGYDMHGVVRRIANNGKTPLEAVDGKFDVVIVGAGSAGISVAASLLTRAPDLEIAVIDPADIHYYQPGWTLVGGGVFEADETVRTLSSVLPDKVHWIKAAVAAFEPDRNAVLLEGCRLIEYGRLVVCPGLKLDWHKIDGLVDTLGKNGVTSNYRFDLAPYTWELVQSMRQGTALFTQPPMPIKCAGAPQKAMYLSADHWAHSGALKNINIEFHNAGGALFGVKEYVPALMDYVKKYDISLQFTHNLVSINGPAKRAFFVKTDSDDKSEYVERSFDMIHVCPPQCAPDFIRVSPLADAAGWVDVDQNTLRHKTYENIWSLGDVMNAPNAKTAAAARKQAPVVAQNLLADMGKNVSVAHYDGYGSCPLTVERGKIVLAEFGYGGKLLPSFPSWMINGQKPSRLAWLMKEKILPPVYWQAMLQGREWLAKPEKVAPEVVN
ncbi:bifunctional protein tyrosine phosphatase family protein/NAD(P)/FAD-dependent oxidoreductase [Pelagibius sp. Alg239-R121]|uniref:bifunctional protein tyrosine phosphatase family protein/NAD(P)/FAD-dependent oxidoreductase n=1 Tax=Pelagibius sp. Alg239-R121 TaxID=2993448 RepID=UPI0024A763DC|nr:bifunctional protein tyrosine phosphatase family protein/NAD(P)/FAD-dependent oxidoreductase [Pelagibius sp. Alg239-R121]